jgi:nitrogen fixation negative regulator NifL
MTDSVSALEELQKELAVLRQQNEEYRRLASFPQLDPIPIFEFTPRGQLIYHNPAADQILIQLNITDASLFLPDDIDEMCKNASAEGEGQYYREQKVEHKFFGESIYYSKEYDTVRIYANDITQRHQEEEAFEQSGQEFLQTQEFIEAVTRGTGVMIVTIDKGMCYTYFNQSYKDEVRRLSGVEIRVGMNILDPFERFPDQQKTISEEWNQVLRGESTNKILEFGDPKAYHRVYNVLHTPMRDAEGEVVGAGEVAYEISEQIRMQEALQAREARFRMVLKNAPVTVAAQDKDLRFIWAYNQRTVNLQDVIGKTDADLFPPEVAAWTMGLKRQVLETGKELHDQGWIISGGQHLFLDIFLEPIRNKVGQITGVGVATVDLTQIKRVEQALTESEERYHSLFRRMTEGFAIHEMIFDENGKPCDYRFLDLNPAFEHLTGVKRERIIGKTYREVLPDEGDVWINIYGKVVLTGEPVQFEQFSPTLNKHFEIFAFRYAPRQFAVIFLDITKRKQMEDDLRVNLTKYRVLFDTLPLGVTITDNDGHILESNQEATRLLGLSEEEQKHRLIQGEEWKIIRPDRTPMPPEEYASVRAMKEQRRIENVEMGVVKGNDQVSWISVTAVPIPLEDYGIVITYNDITRRLLAEEALHRAHDRLEITVQLRTQELLNANEILRMEIDERKRVESQLVIQTRAVEAERKRFNDVLEILPAYLILLTPDYHITFANHYFRERFGEDHGRHCYEYLFGRSEPCENCETYKVLEKGNHHHWEWTGPDTRNYDVYDFPFIDVDGTTLILEMGIDITGRKRAEEQLRSLNAYNRSLIEANLDALVTITPDGRIGDVNSVTETITGYSRAELVGTAFHSYFTDPVRARAGYERVFETGMVRDFELEIQHKDGHITPVVYNASVYRDESGEVTGVFAAARDITERKQAEEKLRQLNAYNRSLIEANLDALVTITSDGKIGDVNSVTEAITGYKRDELIGTDFHSYFSDPNKARSGYQRVFETGILRDYELEIRHRDGHSTPVIFNASVYHYETGKVAGVFAAARDITERKQAERQLVLLNTALQAAANGIILVDKDGSILWSNPAFGRMTGYSNEEIVGKNPRIFKSEKQDQGFYKNLWDTILAGQVWRGEIINRRKDGSLYYEEQTITPVFNHDGEITNFISIRQDITEHKQAEAALKKSEEQYRSLVIATSQIVWQTDASGEVIEDNPIWRAFTGQSVEEFLSWGWINALHPDDQAWVAEIWENAVRAGSSYDIEYRIRSASGDYSDFAVRGVPIKDKDGKILSWVGTCTDITDKKQVENQLLQAEKHAVIGRMVGSVTHEINNPLQTIKNCLYLIQQDTQADSPSAEPLGMALSETQRLSNLVGQLRQLYRSQAVQPRQVQDLRHIIEEVHSLITIQLNDAKVTWQPGPGLQECSVDCVKDQLIEVFLNISTNAIEAMKPAGGTLTIDMVFPANEDKVGIIFTDTGQGIAPDILLHIFEPFTTTKEYGLGLGLSICYTIVQKHGGQITVDSQPGQGTSFTVWLPVVASINDREE